jgi:CRP/FNR family cyclic AMP-dependent transcriptional regulator
MVHLKLPIIGAEIRDTEAFATTVSRFSKSHSALPVQLLTAQFFSADNPPATVRIGFSGEATMENAFDPAIFVAKYGGVLGARYGPKHTLYSQGDEADCVFYFQKGQAQIKVLSKQGKEAVIAVVEPGYFCGEGCLVGEPLRMWTVTTMTDCIVSRLEKAAMIRAIHDDLTFAEFFVMYVLTRTVRLTDDLIDHMFNSSEKRLARILLLLANYGKESRVETAINNIDHQTLAQMVGTTRSRVNFFMNKFRKLSYIDYNSDYSSRISVHSSLLNVVLQDQPIGEIEGQIPLQH